MSIVSVAINCQYQPPANISNYRNERGVHFQVGESFFRHESLTGRDLGVLAAGHYKCRNHELRVLDAMCGCGVRSLRYLAESGADFVVANDANDENRRFILANLGQIPKLLAGKKRWVVTHFDANRVMAEHYLQRDFFDFIDVDSFGSDSSFLRSAFNALKLGGLVYVTSTDGYSAGGHRPYNSLASYGAYIQPMPYANEIGLRMLIGGAGREACVMGYRVTPLFSYYSYHGPVFRVMLRVSRGKFSDTRHYGFISYCHKCGNSQAFTWDKLGKICCSNCIDEPSGSIVLSGPLWTGPLHDGAYLAELLALAQQWGWIGNDVGLDLEKLIRLMIDESNPRLPFGYTKLDEIAKRAKVNSPPLASFISTLQEDNDIKKAAQLYRGFKNGGAHFIRWTIPFQNQLAMGGYAASRSHIVSNAIKTDCPMTTCIRIVKDISNR